MEEIARLNAENARLTAMLHAAQAHEYWEYRDGGLDASYLSSPGWERNHEAEAGNGDECWRRRKV